MSLCVSVQELVTNSDNYLNKVLRIATINDYATKSRTDGIVLAKPVLKRSTSAVVPTYGEHALKEGVQYTFAGSDGRTLIFIERQTQNALQIFASELPGAMFVIDNSSR